MTKLTEEAARALTVVAEERAKVLGIAIATSVVDGGGHPVSFSRMEGTLLASTGLSQNKAYTAVAWQRPSQEMFEVSQPGQSGYGLQSVDSRYVFAGGGLPLADDGQIIGAIGVSGGTAAEDQECAEAAVAAWSA